MPIEMEIRRHFLDRGAATLLPDIQGEALRVVGIAREPVERFLLHPAAPTAGDAAHLEREIDPEIPTGEIAVLARLSVVPCPVRSATPAAACFLRAE
jgi:hypothetical protein